MWYKYFSILTIKILKTNIYGNSNYISFLKQLILRKENSTKTYLHVAFALLAFALVEYILLFDIPEEYIIAMVSQNLFGYSFWGYFCIGSKLANKWTLSQSKNVQYLGLSFFMFY